MTWFDDAIDQVDRDYADHLIDRDEYDRRLGEIHNDFLLEVAEQRRDR